MLGTVRDRINPYGLYLFGMEFGGAAVIALVYTTSTLYWVTVGGLNPFELVLLGTVLEVSYFVLQLPTGILADVVSRRLCVVVGWLFTGAAFLVQGLDAHLGSLLIAQVLAGFGAAVQEGAQDAWIADELDEEAMTPVYVRATQLGIVGGILGALVSGLFGSLDPALPMLVGGGITIAGGLVLAAVMPERNFRRPPAEAEEPKVAGRAWEMFVDQIKSARTAVFAVHGLILVLAMTFFVGMWSESFDRLWGAYFLTDVHFPAIGGLKPAVWFSILAIVVALLSLVSTEIAKRRTDRLGHDSVASTLLVITVCTAIGAVAVAATTAFPIAVVAYLFVQLLRPVYYPLISGWMVSRIRSEVRATALSARDMFDSGGQIIGGPFIGWIGVLGTVRTAILAGGAALAPAILLLVMANRRIRARSGVVEAGTAEPS